MIGVEVDCPFTPAMLRKVTYAGAQAASFVKATEDLAALAEVDLSRERVQRWTKRIGQERAVQVDRQCEAFLALSLPQQRQSPTDQVPQVACVMMDGGRIQIRDRHSPEPSGSSYWKETLVGCCLSMASASSGEDPCPRIPETFVDPQRIGALSREIKGFSGDTESEAQTPPDTPSERSAPKMLVKSVVATRRGIDTFGQKLAATAYARGFHAAPRKAFVADGSATNWGVHQRHFSHYTPILDFTHAICYVYAAAMAGRTLATAWSDYCRWAQWLWEGDTRPLIEAV